MGRVLAAFDLGLDREVALKVLLPGANPERFVRESKITARLPHPGIPPVHALGALDDASPFLAMKLVEGKTLAEEMKGGDRPRLLQAFLQVCQAVGFAHSRGIIHRDLKPANVMVGAFGEVQVMDWGLAKEITSQEVTVEPHASESSPASVSGADPGATTAHNAVGESTDELTQAGQVMGTPAYMAPEQARGEAVDARSDVFALGGILCALLTGQPPFIGKSRLEVLQRARAADLAEVHARLGGCGADAELLALCRSCLRASPAERPADGRAVADDLTAYLGGVQERLQTAQRERAVAVAREAEQRKRRKVQLALAAALLALLAGTGGFAFWRYTLAQAGRERDARNAEAVAALARQGEVALRGGDAAKAAVALGAAKKRSDEGGAENEAERLARLEADLRLLRDLDGVDQLRWTWTGKQFTDWAVVATRIREALVRFGVDPDAVSVDEAAARVAASVLGERIVPALDLLLGQEKKASVRALLQRVDDDPYRNAVRDAALGKDPAKLVALAGKDEALEQPAGFAAILGTARVIPAERRRQFMQAAVSRSPGNLGLLMTLAGTYRGRDKRWGNELLRWDQAAVAAAPDNFAANINLGHILSIDKGDHDGAIGYYRRATEIDPTSAHAHVNLGAALQRKGKVDEAIDCCRKAIKLDPKEAQAHNNLGYALHSKGKVDEAVACYRKALALDPKLIQAHNNLGASLLDDKGKVDEAIECFKKAIACVHEDIEFDPEHTSAHFHLGRALSRKGKLNEAIASYRKAIEIDPKNVYVHVNLGVALASKGKLEEAIACYRKAIELDPKLTQAHVSLGTALRDKGKVDEAMTCYQKAIALDPKDARAHTALGAILCDVKRDYDGAIDCFRKAIALDPKLAQAHFNLGSALYRKGQVDEAIAWYKKAIELDAMDARAHLALGFVLFRQGQFAEAEASTRRGLALLPSGHSLRPLASRQVQQCQGMLALEKKLLDVLAGKLKPASAGEQIGLAGVCALTKRYQASARLFADAFTAEPALVPVHRYNAACSAALAAAGRGEDAAGLDQKVRRALLRQALTWLRADLDAWRPRLKGLRGPEARATLLHWQKDPDLAGLRDRDALAKLPAEERAACERLWADVASLLKTAEERAK
jgi:tetratricopeptide (TPR) repeat protein